MKLSAEKLGLSFDGRMAVADVTFDLAEGERVLLTGASLSGKTSLLKLVAGLAQPTAGDLRWDGVSVSRLSRVQKRKQQARFGMVFQTDALFDSKTVLANVALPLQNRGVPSAEAKSRAEAVLEKVGLSQALHKRPEQLSGGMRKRAGIARAIVAQPQVLIADDPLAGLDPRTASQVCALLSEVSSGRTLLFCAPDPPEEFLFPRWLVMEGGRLSHDGPPSEAALAGAQA